MGLIDVARPELKKTTREKAYVTGAILREIIENNIRKDGGGG